MSRWRQQGSLWCLESPSSTGVIEFIGGSVLAATPQISYRRLLEALYRRGLSLRAWSYVPGFDHQAQATEAWRAFRRARQDTVAGAPVQPVLRLGHSLGCKLHLLAPDGGRGSSALVAMSFNNFSADRSIPLLADLAPRLGVRTEFSPSPQETLRLVSQLYGVPRNLLIRFGSDALDQSPPLLEVLQQRPGDSSSLLQLGGDHLTPASAGLRQNLLGTWADDPARQRQIDRLAAAIDSWWRQVEPGSRDGQHAKVPAF